ncbi:TrmH family RNA methyltransferase [Desulfovibrio inopinatus]|uniref:TrmH family RNA methyltransferase n=1 Tax=Desulfovibrio inopinatus TaxID=102109 RepID=UPI000415490F|nr:RNA methyltransferase [Desulfovibrio inopinatus]
MARERTERRMERIQYVLERRQKDLTLIINNIHDPHNVSAILRSCDAFGVGHVHLYYTDTPFPVLGKKTSASAKKWITMQRHTNGPDMVNALSQKGFQIVRTGFSATATSLLDWDFTRPTAVVMGNEHDGVDDELMQLVDKELYIPMSGMVQSLNVSVASAVILYEAYRQRQEAGFYDQPSYSAEEIETLQSIWSQK